MISIPMQVDVGSEGVRYGGRLLREAFEVVTGYGGTEPPALLEVLTVMV